MARGHATAAHEPVSWWPAARRYTTVRGSLNVMRAPAAGASSRCGATRRGCSNVLNAFRSGPVSVSHASTRVGVTSPPLQRQLALAVEVAVQHQHARLTVLRVERRDDVDERHLIVAGEVGLQSRRA